jgi:hypothetical protein
MRCWRGLHRKGKKRHNGDMAWEVYRTKIINGKRGKMENNIIIDTSRLELAIPSMESVMNPETVKKAREKARRILRKMELEEAREARKAAKAAGGG